MPSPLGLMREAIVSPSEDTTAGIIEFSNGADGRSGLAVYLGMLASSRERRLVQFS